MMIFNELSLQGCFQIKQDYFTDNRGEFGRLFCVKEFEKKKLKTNFVQVNHSKTIKVGSVRGMHYQNVPYCEVKLVKCIKGTVWDVIVDLRKDSPTFLEWDAIELSASKKNMIYIPEGCAHGFQVLEEGSELLYFHSQYYSPDSEAALNFKDPQINISWPLDITEVSDKDKGHKFLDNSFEGVVI